MGGSSRFPSSVFKHCSFIIEPSSTCNMQQAWLAKSTTVNPFRRIDEIVEKEEQRSYFDVWRNKQSIMERGIVVDNMLVCVRAQMACMSDKIAEAGRYGQQLSAA